MPSHFPPPNSVPDGRGPHTSLNGSHPFLSLLSFNHIHCNDKMGRNWAVIESLPFTEKQALPAAVRKTPAFCLSPPNLSTHRHIMCSAFFFLRQCISFPFFCHSLLLSTLWDTIACLDPAELKLWSSRYVLYHWNILHTFWESKQFKGCVAGLLKKTIGYLCWHPLLLRNERIASRCLLRCTDHLENRNCFLLPPSSTIFQP